MVSAVAGRSAPTVEASATVDRRPYDESRVAVSVIVTVQGPSWYIETYDPGPNS